MTIDLKVTLIETESELLEVVPLKQADDSEVIGTPISEDLALEKIKGLYDWGHDIWIAKSGDKPVGYSIGRKEAQMYHSYGTYIIPEMRNLGLGTVVLRAKIESARKNGSSEIWTSVARTNESSIRMLEKLGFEFEPSGQGYVVRLKLHENRAFSQP